MSQITITLLFLLFAIVMFMWENPVFGCTVPVTDLPGYSKLCHSSGSGNRWFLYGFFHQENGIRR